MCVCGGDAGDGRREQRWRERLRMIMTVEDVLLERLELMGLVRGST